MNRCIQCTRCIRFTEEISGTSELGFFERGARTEIGVFPGKELDNPLSGCVVDICPVGALTSKNFRFSERVWYLDKTPSICTGCDVGCNISVEHRRGAIKRYKPRFNPEVNDYWMCDYGRLSHFRYAETERLLAPRHKDRSGDSTPYSWDEAMVDVHRLLSAQPGESPVIAGSGSLSTEEAYLLAALTASLGGQVARCWVDSGPERVIPTAKGEMTGSDCAPNRRGVLLAGLGDPAMSTSAQDFVDSDDFDNCSVLLIADSDFGKAAYDDEFVTRIRGVDSLIVFGWADSPLAKAADIALPLATPAETSGSFVNAQKRMQRFEKAYAPAGESREGVEVFAELLSRFDQSWDAGDRTTLFARIADRLGLIEGCEQNSYPAHGILLASDSGSETPSEPVVESGSRAAAGKQT